MKVSYVLHMLNEYLKLMLKSCWLWYKAVYESPPEKCVTAMAALCKEWLNKYTLLSVLIKNKPYESIKVMHMIKK